MIVGNYEKFCKDYHLCECYEKAINSSESYFLHHIQGENISKEELIEKDLYYDCEPENLRWVTKTEHNKIHMTGKKGENHPLFGKEFSEEHRRKLSLAKKGKKRKPFTDEHKRKMSEAKKGDKNPSKRPDVRGKMSEAAKGKPSWTKGKSWKLVDGKRKYFSK